MNWLKSIFQKPNRGVQVEGNAGIGMSGKKITVLCYSDPCQLKKEYGDKVSRAIKNNIGNHFYGMSKDFKPGIDNNEPFFTKPEL